MSVIYCDDDVSTVKNKKIQNDCEERKDTKSGSLSNQSNQSKNECNLDILANIPGDPTEGFKKVTDWLETSYVSPENRAIKEYRGAFCLLEIESPAKIKWIHSNKRRVRVILMNTNPSINGEALDFVSGFCSEDTEYFKFTELYWERSKSSGMLEMVPHCPSCMKMGKKSVVILSFMMKMCVLDNSGFYLPVVAYKHFAENFFGCTAEEFVKDYSVRQSKIKLLNKLMELKGGCQVQFLDIFIAISDNIGHLISGRLD